MKRLADQTSDLATALWPACLACRLTCRLWTSRIAQEPPRGRDVIQELGVRSFINAAGTFTALTGSLMRPEAVAAMQVASRKFVRLEDLHDAVGKTDRRAARLPGRPGDRRLCLGAFAGHRGLHRRQPTAAASAVCPTRPA